MYEKIDINKNCFDIIRVICTFTVFLGHFLTHFGIPRESLLYHVAYFIKGVPVFFFLSGFFIASSLERYNTKKYIVKRICRIFPELWCCVIFNLVVILCVYNSQYTIKDIAIYLITQLTIFQFYTGPWLRDYGVGAPNGALWTITVTIQFYILAIFIKKIKLFQSLSILILLIFVDYFIYYYRTVFPELIWKLILCNIIPFIWIFFIGMIVYKYRNYTILFMVKYRLLFCIMYIIWNYFVPDNFIYLFSGVRYNIITTLLLISCIISIGFSFNIRLKNEFSYSFYLYHMVILNIINHTLIANLDNILLFVITIVISVLLIYIIANISYNLIEKKISKSVEKLFANYIR